jgi:hypothetical protein
MKERELREHTTCTICKKKIGHTGLPLFWTARIQRHGLKRDALMRQQGLAMMLGGSGALAMAMGPDEEMTETLEDVELTLCEDCAMPLMELIERARP